MFSGIIETIGIVKDVRADKGNLHLFIEAPFTSELKIDQSIAHNGACLTVVGIQGNVYSVTAIGETLSKTNLASLQAGDRVNLERCLKIGDRLDGHMVQGHVDGVGVCESITEENGSWKIWFSYSSKEHITVAKGSICVNGISLTVVDSEPGKFSVAIIPYTMENTTFKSLKKGDKVNLEFDVVGKYIQAMLKK